VYHSRDLFGGFTDVGVSYAKGQSAGTGTPFGYRLTLQFGLPIGANSQGASDVVTYPCQGTTNALASFIPSTESPNPAPDVGTATVGTPIYIKAPTGTRLSVDSAVVKKTADGSTATVRVMTQANDPQQRLTSNEAFLLPLAALTAGAAYQVTVSATVSGVHKNIAFTFTPN